MIPVDRPAVKAGIFDAKMADPGTGNTMRGSRMHGALRMACARDRLKTYVV